MSLKVLLMVILDVQYLGQDQMSLIQILNEQDINEYVVLKEFMKQHFNTIKFLTNNS